MKRYGRIVVLGVVAALSATASTVSASSFVFSAGNPDGKIGAASQPSSPAKIEKEAADDFIVTLPTRITGASFTGLLTRGATIGSVVAEIYRVFPKDSTNPPSGNVPTRVNSPSDIAFDSRDSGAGGLSFTTTDLGSFTVANSVLNGINKIPNQRTGGEGAVSGEEIRFDLTFATPFTLPADHYFFVPQVDAGSGVFYWLSAPKPIVAPGTPFLPDLQAWIRDENLSPDWLRIGTDIVGGAPAPTYNMSFSLEGTVPEPSMVVLLGTGLLLASRRARRR